MKYSKACVTGGAGFIGSKLVRRLLSRGVEVRVIDNLSVGRIENVPEGAELLVGDILDSPTMERAVQGCNILFHLAARVAIRSSFEFVVEDTTVNVAGTAAALRAAHRAGSVKRVVSTSSMAVYADAPEPYPIPETHPAIPVSPYGVSKLASESLVHLLASQAGMESAVLRLFNTYGPGQKFSPYVGVVTIFVNKLLSGETATIFGDGAQARDFVHVEDIVSGFVAAMDSAVSGETFNIGTGHATTVNEVYRLVAEHLNVSREPLHAPAVAGELRYSIADVAKAERMLGYSPRRRFQQSIGNVIDEIRAGSGVAR